MREYRKCNNAVGWLLFLISFFVYFLTMDRSASLWDCGEFIATAYKMQVGHPPGAPLYMLLARFFSLFAPNEAWVAFCINLLSVLASALTILLLFWTITHLGRRLLLREEAPSRGQTAALMVAGAVGALAYCFSDTFWFSAVEAEVYALSSLFTAAVVWLMLKWEDQSEEPHANRWLVLIAYLMGLSIGVHLLNLLTIPALVLIYYFRKYDFSWSGFTKSFLLGILLLAVVLYGLIPGLPRMAGWMELLFVNRLRLPLHSGALAFIALLLGLLVVAVLYTHRRRLPVWNTVLLCAFVMTVGYLSYAYTPIRSSVNPPIDENNPADIFSLQRYLNREQYGDRPLLYGHYYSAPLAGEKNTYTWYLAGDRYEKRVSGKKFSYDPRFETIFPRMYSWQGHHVQQYKAWAGGEGRPVVSPAPDGQRETLYCPTFGQNLRFFFTYQLHHMYWRYFLWNFAGRQDDTHNPGGDLLHGNWLSGIKFLDQIHLGNRSSLTEEMKAEPAYNRYFSLPLLLGIIGLFYQIRRDGNNATVVAFLFFFTGIAIVLYLNQTPLQPRERDYSYAASFYAFAMWIGLAALWLYERLQKRVGERAAVGLAGLLLLVPAQMGYQNWDDHNRSTHTIARAMAYNYLNSCAPNAILFTVGDNDTFPLWYLQEVEGIRTDVRVCNLSLLRMDWYIDQMKRQSYNSAPLPIEMGSEAYAGGNRDVVYVVDRLEGQFPLRDVMRVVASEAYRIDRPNQPSVDYIPCRNVTLPVAREKVLANGIVARRDSASIDSVVSFSIPGNHLIKSSLMVLEIIANNNWERPIYFTSLVGDANVGLSEYMQLDGYAYRLVPIRTPSRGYMTEGRVDADSLYVKLTERFEWGGMGKPGTFVSYDIRRNANVIGIRHLFVRTAEALLQQGDAERALEILNQSLALMPHPAFPYDYSTLHQIDLLYKAGAQQQGDALLLAYIESEEGYQRYFETLSPALIKGLQREIAMRVSVLRALTDLGLSGGGEAARARCATIAEYYFERGE